MDSDHLHGLLRALDEDPKKAGDLYRQLHQRLIRLFRLNSVADPEAAADEGMDRLARRIFTAPAEEILSPQAFLLGIARHLLQEEARRKLRETQAATEWMTRSQFREGHDEHLLQALDECLTLMREDQRTLLRSYYQWVGKQKIEHHRELAQTFGLTINAMRNRLMRARNELDKCIRKRCSDVFDQPNTKS